MSQQQAMTGDPVALAVCEVLAEVLHRKTEEIALDASLEHGLGMDSMTTIEASIALEERLDVAFPDFATPDEVGLHTVRDLIRLTRERVDARDDARRH